MLTVTLTPTPASGPAPLNTTLSADVSGTATGTINYTFWWNCTDPGTSVSAVTAICGDPNNSTIGAKFDGVTADPQTVSHTYATSNTFTAKVIAERGSAPPAEDRKTVTVTGPNQPPNPPTGINQFRSDGVTVVPVGGSTPESTVVFKGTVSDPDAGQQVKLQVEVRPLGTGFSNISTNESGLVTSGSQATVSVPGLSSNTSYHWQARTLDSLGAPSAWVAFGRNAETAADFTVSVPAGNAPTLAFTGETGYRSDGVEPNSGTSSTTFTFRVKYTDADADAPQAGSPKVHILQSGTPIGGSPFAMSFVSGAPATGEIYTYSTTLLAGSYTYRFEAADSNGAPATGPPTSSQSGPTVTAAPGGLDPTFGTGGMVVTHVVPPTLSCSCNNGARALAIQADGKIVAAGGTLNVSGQTFHGDFAIVRYNQDGSLDTAFGTGGMVITDIGVLTEDGATALRVQTDGKLVVAGNTRAGSGSIMFAVVRYNPDGSLDHTFGQGGKMTGVFDKQHAQVTAVAIQTDGKIVVAGQSYPNIGNPDFGLARLNSDGSVDVGFGTNGIVSTDFANDSIDFATALAIQADGKILVAGQTYPTGGGNASDFALARYNSDGTLDTTFGSLGKVITDFTGRPDHALALAIQGDGKMVVGGGAFTQSLREDFALARYASDGTLDPTFGIGGKTTNYAAPSPSNNLAQGVAIQADGRVAIAGWATFPSQAFVVGRFNADGTVDTGFGTGGVVTTTSWTADGSSSFSSAAFSVAIQADGKLVVAGEAHIGQSGQTGNRRFALARYEIGSTQAFNWPLASPTK